jgi:hypothetical protein
VTEGAAAESGEIGWVELDDLSQLSELEGVGDLAIDREYSFEEADEATLAELGIAPEAAAEAPAEEKKPARRRSTKKPATEAAAEAPAEEKKPARRRGTKKDATAEATAEAVAEEKPKPARSRSGASRGSGTSRSRRTASATEAPADESTATEAPANEKKPARRRSTRKEADASAPDGEPGEEGEGIWQRFRSARGRSTPG